MTIILHDGKIFHVNKRKCRGIKKMSNQETLEKICSFYVSEWHMVTMLLPYINKQIENNVNVETILQQEIEKNVTELVSRLHTKNEEKIKAIYWKQRNLVNYKEIEKLLDKAMKNNNETIIIVNGTNEYIGAVNTNIENYMQKHIRKLAGKGKKVKVINCYEVMQFNYNINTILDMHDKVLNTSGEKEIEEMFAGYHRKETAAMENAN